MKISIIHPSRNRPKQAIQTATKWLGSAKDITNIEYILSLDNGDEYIPLYKQEFDVIRNNVNIIFHDNRSAIDAINNAAKLTVGDLLIVVSDDFDCFQDWDEKLLEEVNGKEDFILKTQDGIQPFIITIPILDRKYYERFGYIYYPEYKHMFCDTEMSCVGHVIGKTIKSNLYFKHNHYITGMVKKDGLNVRNDSTWNQGKELFYSRLAKNFDLKSEEIINLIPKEANI